MKIRISLWCALLVFHCFELPVSGQDKKQESNSIHRTDSRPDSNFKQQGKTSSKQIDEEFMRTYYSLTTDKKMVSGLDLSQTQLSQLKQSRTERTNWFTEAYKIKIDDLKTVTPSLHDRTIASKEAWNVVRLRIQKQIHAVLLPHQVRILKSLALQRILKKHGFIAIMNSDLAKAALEIGDHQDSLIQTRIKDETKTLNEELRRIKNKFQKNVFSELTPTQRRLLGVNEAPNKPKRNR